MRNALYWLGDRIGNRNPIVVSVSAEPVKHGDIKLLGQLAARDRHGTPVWAYQVPTRPEGFGKRVPIVSAIPMLVSETDNETRRRLHRMTPSQLKTYLDSLNVAAEPITAQDVS